MFRSPKNFRRNFISGIITLIILVVSVFVAKLLPGSPEAVLPEGKLTASFIDVDQGDSCMLATPEGKIILVDGGEYSEYETHLKPFLDSKGIEKVDMAVVTHYHSDHMGGISKLVSDGRVENLILPDYEDTDDSRAEIEEYAKSSNTAVSYVSAGDDIDCGTAGMTVKVLHPARGGFNDGNYHNNNSLVIRVDYGKTSMLITGDIESVAEKSLVGTADIECDILKLPHHGSSSSSSKSFIRAANPTYGIISAGKDNRYGHPHNEVLDLMQDEDIIIYRTDTDGDITFTLNPEGIEKSEFSK